MKCIVTGCAGFIGSHLSEKLIEKGFEVIGVDSLSDYYPEWIKIKNLENLNKKKGFSFFKSSIEDLDLENLINGVDYIFHLAAQAGVRASWGKDFSIYVRANILSTQKLLESIKEKSIKKFIFASSSSVYGICPELPMKEKSPLIPISPYGVTKLAGEQLCFLYFKNYNLPVVSLRYFTVYGPRQRPDMAFHKFMKALLEGKEIIIYGSGEQTRDFTYIDDVIEATCEAAFKGKIGEVYNIGGGHQIKLIEALKIIKNIAKREVKIKKVDTLKGEMQHTLAFIEKAKKDLEFTPRTRLEQGLLKQWQWIIELYGDKISKGREI